jgi:hypothetical protein
VYFTRCSQPPGGRPVVMDLSTARSLRRTARSIRTGRFRTGPARWTLGPTPPLTTHLDVCGIQGQPRLVVGDLEVGACCSARIQPPRLSGSQPPESMPARQVRRSPTRGQHRPPATPVSPTDRTQLLRRSVALRPRLPPPKSKVRDRRHPGGADNRHHRGPQPLRASNLACWPTPEVDKRRNLEDPFGNGHGDEQSAGALAEIAPLFPGGHDILRIRQGIPHPCGRLSGCGDLCSPLRVRDEDTAIGGSAARCRVDGSVVARRDVDHRPRCCRTCRLADLSEG